MKNRARPASKPRSGAAPRKTRVLVVDDHPTMREGLMRVLGREPDLTVCGEAGGIQQALEVLETAQPDLVLVDISLSGENGLELIKQIRADDPGLLVLVHSMHDEEVYAERALEAGANGYVMKHEPTSELLQAIRRVLQGEIYLKTTTMKQIVHRLATGQSFEGASPLRLLSEREFDVLKLMGQGFGTRQIASALLISIKTVHVHRANIKRKLDLKDSAGLVHYAIRWVAAQS